MTLDRLMIVDCRLSIEKHPAQPQTFLTLYCMFGVFDQPVTLGFGLRSLDYSNDQTFEQMSSTVV